MNPPLNITKQNILFAYIGWWSCWIAVQTMLVHHYGQSWLISFTDAATTNFLIAAGGFGIAQVFKFANSINQNRLYRMMAAVGMSAAVVYFHQLGMNYFLADKISYIEFVKQAIPVRFVYVLISITTLALISWLWYFIKEQQNISLRNDDAEKLLREAELARLRLQLQPHFLFNSLNSINALVGSQPNEARKMVQQLADFLRGTLKKDDQQLVTLADELEHLQLYLEIEKVRFGHRLNTQIETDVAVLKMKLPSLLLQPLMENAIKFGLYDTTGNLTILLKASQSNSQLTIEISNPYDAETAQPRQGTGFGLSAVQRRLYLLYARNDLLQIERNDGIFTTKLLLPQ